MDILHTTAIFVLAITCWHIGAALRRRLFNRSPRVAPHAAVARDAGRFHELSELSLEVVTAKAAQLPSDLSKELAVDRLEIIIIREAQVSQIRRMIADLPKELRKEVTT